MVLPDLAVIRIAVYDENGKMLGQRILPMDGLQAGYRHVSLRTDGNFPMSLAMLFICIELKIYVPDGLGDLMDALSDPRAFLSAQEKRMVQMRAMGIEEADILVNRPDLGSQQKKDDDKREEWRMEAITVDALRAEKDFVKLRRKQMKELEGLRKRHHKDKQQVQKQQCLAVEKLLPKGAASGEAPSEDCGVRALVVQQMHQWSTLLGAHQAQEWDLLRGHLSAQGALLKSLMLKAQAQQMKQLDAKFERENKEMKTKQAKVSVETAREVSSDKTLRNKAERERRLREKNSNNTKKFIEERRSAALKQSKERERLKKIHEKQLHDLQRETDNGLELYNAAEVEYKLCAKLECFV